MLLSLTLPGIQSDLPPGALCFFTGQGDDRPSHVLQNIAFILRTLATGAVPERPITLSWSSGETSFQVEVGSGLSGVTITATEDGRSITYHDFWQRALSLPHLVVWAEATPQWQRALGESSSAWWRSLASPRSPVPSPVSWARPEHLPLAVWVASLAPTRTWSHLWREIAPGPLGGVSWRLHLTADVSDKATTTLLHLMDAAQHEGSLPEVIWRFETVAASNRQILTPWGGNRWATFRAWCDLMDEGVLREIRLGVQRQHERGIVPWEELPRGERQFLERMAFLSLLEEQATIFCLDGWDVGLSPAWQRELLVQTERFLAAGSQALWATDSPTIVGDAHPTEVLRVRTRPRPTLQRLAALRERLAGAAAGAA
jgi:hypothetical protein